MCLYLLRECKFSSVMQVANRGEGKVPATDYHVEPPEQNCPAPSLCISPTLEFGISPPFFLVFVLLVFLYFYLDKKIIILNHQSGGLVTRAEKPLHPVEFSISPNFSQEREVMRVF